jgi:hypothetical protein
MFVGIVIVLLYFEVSSIFEDINGIYQGKFFRIGWLVFILGIWIFIRKYFKK